LGGVKIRDFLHDDTLHQNSPKELVFDPFHKQGQRSKRIGEKEGSRTITWMAK
jgi:hypothetical protein